MPKFERRTQSEVIKMNRFLIVIFAMVLMMFSCKGNQTKENDEVPADSSDSADTAGVDSMEMLISETPMPKAADELFDDFFFNFAANRKLQCKRIKFPLPVYRFGKLDSITKVEWKMNHFFMRQGYYTLILNNKHELDMVKDTSINHVVVERIDLAHKFVKQFLFNRINGQWMMTSVNQTTIAKNANASFLHFYHKFSQDTAYQLRSLAQTVEFIGPAPDDDFSNMEGIITPETWPAFAPQLPHRIIYNIIYGNVAPKRSSRKFFMMRGIANGLEMELAFRIIGGRWKLTKFTT